MLLTAVQATDEQLIAPSYMMRISAHPANFFNFTNIVYCWFCKTLCHHILDTFQSEWQLHLGEVLLPTERCSLLDAFNGNVAIFIVYK